MLTVEGFLPSRGELVSETRFRMLKEETLGHKGGDDQTFPRIVGAVHRWKGGGCHEGGGFQCFPPLLIGPRPRGRCTNDTGQEGG